MISSAVRARAVNVFARPEKNGSWQVFAMGRADRIGSDFHCFPVDPV